MFYHLLLFSAALQLCCFPVDNDKYTPPSLERLLGKINNTLKTLFILLIL
jgi:hypothetical protein